MAAHAEAADHHHGPPVANQSSRVDSRVLGMFLFIASEVDALRRLLHGVLLHPRRQRDAVAARRFHLPVFVAGVNTAILVTSRFTVHWALQSIKRGNRPGCRPGSCSRS